MVRTKAEDDYDRKLLSDIEQYGWHLVGINDDPNGPAYVFSVGMYHRHQQPEICIFGLRDTGVMGQIVNEIGDLMQSGETFEDWQASDDVLDNYPCVFRAVDRSLYGEYFGYARWFYEGDDFPMLQCVWPDESGYFPWDSKFDSELAQTEPVLAQKSSWPFDEAKNTSVFTTVKVVDDGYPVLLVSHDDEGDWQFLCNTTNDTKDARVVCLQYVVENHPSVCELADLPIGWQAMRDGPDQPWERIRSSERQSRSTDRD